MTETSFCVRKKSNFSSQHLIIQLKIGFRCAWIILCHFKQVANVVLDRAPSYFYRASTVLERSELNSHRIHSKIQRSIESVEIHRKIMSWYENEFHKEHDVVEKPGDFTGYDLKSWKQISCVWVRIAQLFLRVIRTSYLKLTMKKTKIRKIHIRFLPFRSFGWSYEKWHFCQWSQLAQLFLVFENGPFEVHHRKKRPK